MLYVNGSVEHKSSLIVKVKVLFHPHQRVASVLEIVGGSDMINKYIKNTNLAGRHLSYN